VDNQRGAYTLTLYLITKEQYEEMIKKGEGWFDDGYRPLRFMHKSITAGDALYFMRHYSKYYNSLCVWHLEQQQRVAILDSLLPLDFDSIAPLQYESYYTIWESDQGKMLVTNRRLYDYPHPSGRYEGT
jgi:hypothetical protein